MTHDNFIRNILRTVYFYAFLTTVFTNNLSHAATNKDASTSSVEKISTQRYGSAGCGLGSVLFKNQTGLIQISASITNVTTGSQTFGISTGTSNCEPTYANETSVTFIEINRVKLEKDISRGGGETLVHFSKSIGCENSELLGNRLQLKFTEVFKESSDAYIIKNNIDSIIQSDQELRMNCKQNANLANN